jgi:hypothetical protein
LAAFLSGCKTRARACFIASTNVSNVAFASIVMLHRRTAHCQLTQACILFTTTTTTTTCHLSSTFVSRNSAIIFWFFMSSYDGQETVSFKIIKNKNKKRTPPMKEKLTSNAVAQR